MDAETINLILIAALAVSEVLASIPQVRANSIFQAIYNILKKLKR